MPLCRASQLDRLLNCPGELWLPRTDIVSPKTMEARDWGTACHKWAETGEMPNFYKFRELLEKKLAKSGTLREDYWWNGDRELPLAYNVVSGQAMAYAERPENQSHLSGDDWKQSFGDEWITGTLDYGETPFDQVWVDDLKTGRLVAYAEYASQQKFYCAVYSLVKHGEVRDSRSTLTHWPRYPLHAKPVRGGDLEVYYEAGELVGFLKGLREFREEALTHRPEVLQTGEHCRFCSSKLDCPAFINENQV